MIEGFPQGHAGTHVNDIHHRAPIPAELPNLLGIHLKQQRDFVGMLSRFRLDIRQIDPAP